MAVAGVATASWNRCNLQRLFVGKKEAKALVQLDSMLQEHYGGALPSLTSGLLVRFKLEGQYHLRLVECTRTLPNGKPALAVLSTNVQSVDFDLAVAHLIPLPSISSTNPLEQQSWVAIGEEELGRLQASMHLRHQALPLHEAAAVAWRKQAALSWHATHGSQPLEQQVAALGELAAAIQDAHGIAGMQQLLEPETEQVDTPEHAEQLTPDADQKAQQEERQEIQHVPGFTVRLSGTAAAPAGSGGTLRQPWETLDSEGANGAASNELNGGSGVNGASGLNEGSGGIGRAGRQPSPRPSRLGMTTSRRSRSRSPRKRSRSRSRSRRRSASRDHRSRSRERQRHHHRSPVRRRRSGSPARHIPHAAAGMSRQHHHQQQQQQQGPAGPPHAGPPLVPVLMRHFKVMPGKPERTWELIGCHVFVCVPKGSTGPELRDLAESTGGTVRTAHVKPGDRRGDIGFVEMDTPMQAASLVEKLQGTMVDGHRLFLRPYAKEVQAIAERFPQEAAAARDFLQAAILNDGGGGNSHGNGGGGGGGCGGVGGGAREGSRAAGPEQQYRGRTRARSPVRSRSRSRGRGRGAAESWGVGQVAARVGAARREGTPEARRPDASPGRHLPLHHRQRSRSRSRSRSLGRHRLGMSGVSGGRGGRALGSPAAAALAGSPGMRHIAAAAAGDRGAGGPGGGSFWDPIWVLEWQVLVRLRAQGRMPVAKLLDCVDWVPELGPTKNAECLFAFLRRRPHLFDLFRGGEVVSAEEGAEPFLRYKRSILQYLADNPVRVGQEQLAADVRPPENLPTQFRALSISAFLRQFLASEVWTLVGTKIYADPFLAKNGTAELRPFLATGPQAPAFPPVCRHFVGTAESCKEGVCCPLSHARPRLFA